ncbi:hypothetical protein RJ55_01118 [Drechmeria coniospora]|nr:hypothetical protein RJ55_01118 [Drechmeria coniospora]
MLALASHVRFGSRQLAPNIIEPALPPPTPRPIPRATDADAARSALIKTVVASLPRRRRDLSCSLTRSLQLPHLRLLPHPPAPSSSLSRKRGNKVQHPPQLQRRSPRRRSLLGPRRRKGPTYHVAFHRSTSSLPSARCDRKPSSRECGPTTTTTADSSSSSSSEPTANEARTSTSSDDTLREGASGHGAPPATATATAGAVDADERSSMNAPPDQAENGSDDGDRTDAATIYPASHYPRAASPRGTAMHYYQDDPNADIAASTRSIWVPDLDYRDIHGRRYAREYYMPNDEIEQLRLSLQHQVFLHLLDGELTCVELNDPTFVLDVGTGTGEWAIRMAEMYPDCEVVGTDISAMADTKRVPLNVFFEIEDAEEWERPADHYDLIHFRCLEGAFRDWRSMYDSVYNSLKPGGWIEMIDFDSLESVKIWFTAFSEGSPIFDMAGDLEIAAEKIGRKRGISHMDPQLLMEAGFVDVRVTEHSIPMRVGEKSAGKLWLISCLDALEANCLRLLTQVMGWDPDKCKAACEKAARELAQLAKDPVKAKGLLVKARTVMARKPQEAGASNEDPAYHAGWPTAD